MTEPPALTLAPDRDVRDRRYDAVMRGWCAAVIVVVVSGCSWIAMPHVDDPKNPTSDPECTTSTVAPAIDLIGIGADAAYTILVDASDVGGDAKGAVTIVGIIAAIAHIASSQDGFRYARECSEARAAWNTIQIQRAADERRDQRALDRPKEQPATEQPAAEGPATTEQPDAGAPKSPPAALHCYRTQAKSGERSEHCFPSEEQCVRAHDVDATKTDELDRISECKPR